MMLRLILSFLFTAPNALAQTPERQVISVDQPGLEAQRQDYENNLQHKIKNALGNILEENSYVLNVSVFLKNLPPEEIALETSKKAEKTVVEPQERLQIQTEFNGEEGLIPLSKLGVWTAPKQEVENTQEEEITQPQKRVFKRLRNFAELIGRIKINLLLDENRVDADRQAVAERVIQQITDGHLPVQAQLSVQAFNMGTTATTKENMKKELMNQLNAQVEKIKSDIASKRNIASVETKGTFEWISELKDSLALLFSSIILFLMGLIISKRYIKIQEKRISSAESLALSQQATAENTSTEEGTIENAELTEDRNQLNPDAISGFKQFQHLLNEKPERSTYLIKQWLYSDDEATKALIVELPHQIDLTDLQKIIDLLSSDDRKQWNRVNSLQTKAFPIAQLDQLIKHKLSSSLIEPELEIEEKTKQLIASMSPQEGVNCIQKEPATGALLASVMPTLQYTRILSLIDNNTIRKIAQLSSQMDDENIKYTALKLEKLILEHRKQTKSQSSNFIEKVPEMIRDLGYQKEDALFESVAEKGNDEALIRIAEQFYPSSLIEELPVHIAQKALQPLGLAKQAELIFAAQEKREFLLESIGNKKLREIIEVEMDEIETNEDRKNLVYQNFPKAWQSFIDSIRRRIREDHALQSEVHPILNQWAKSQVSRQSGAQNAS